MAVFFKGALSDHFYQAPNSLARTPGIKSRAVHVMSNLLTHDPGFEISTRIISEQTGLSKPTVMAALDDLAELGFLTRIRVPGEQGRFDSFDYELDLYNIPEVQQRVTPVKNVYQGSQQPVKKLDQAPVKDFYQEPVNIFDQAPVKNFDRIEQQLKHQEEQQEENDHINQKVDEPTDHDFNEFWNTVPRKVSKKAARKAWDKATKTTHPQTIINGMRRYRDDPNRNPAYTKHPTTWLNQGCWEDDPLPPKPTTHTKSKSQRYLELGERLAQEAEAQHTQHTQHLKELNCPF